LVFAFQPAGGAQPRGFASTAPITLARWSHVAVTCDGHELRMFIDDRLDAQYASVSAMHAVHVPLVIGNQLDARLLTESRGPLQVPPDSAPSAFYAFDGAIDEMRLSSVALGTGATHR